MSEDLLIEVEVINSIYGDGTLIPTDINDVYSLRISCFTFPLKLQFDADYPASPPTLLGSDTSGVDIRREESSHAVETFKNALNHSFEPGQVCLYDVIEEVILQIEAERAIKGEEHHAEESFSSPSTSTQNTDPRGDFISNSTLLTPPPSWSLSDIVIESKSVFIARAAPVSSPEQAKQYVTHLLDSDKKIRTATHNITAWRIKGENEVTFQDCDDDGETAAGGRVLHLMQLMDLWDVMVVVTRWYGGHQLGPKRFSIINAVARDAFVKGNFVDDGGVKKKGKR